MRVVTDAQAAVLASGVQGEHLRVTVKDASGTWRDLGEYPGFDAVKSASWSGSVSDPHRTAAVVLHRSQDDLSLSPFLANSPINLGFDPTATSAPLLALKREIQIYVAITAMDAAPVESDWMLIFHGRLDRIDPAKGNEVHLSARDLGGRLAQQFIKHERVYSFAEVAGVTVALRIWKPQMVVKQGEYVVPSTRGEDDSGFSMFFEVTSAGDEQVLGITEPTWANVGTITDGAAELEYAGDTDDSGHAVEQIVQNILDDNRGTGDGAVTLATPETPAWFIKKFKQQREFTLDAVRTLAHQIGWDAKFLWSEADEEFQLTFFQPQRDDPPIDYTFSPADYGKPESFAIDITQIRNDWTVIYSASDEAPLPDGETLKRSQVRVRDEDSIEKYGELCAEMQEDFTSQVDTLEEATALAEAALSDCSEPTAEVGLPLVRGFPWVEENDFLKLEADGVRFGADQSLAVSSWSQVFESGKLRTKLELRGKPSIGARTHLMNSAHPRIPIKVRPHQLDIFQGGRTAKVDFFDSVGGTTIAITRDIDKAAAVRRYEHYISDTPGFTLDASTLAVVSADGSVEIQDLVPGKTHYHRVVESLFNGERYVGGQPSIEKSFVAGRAHGGHLQQDQEWGRQPLNGGFETWKETSLVPDHWATPNGTWGVNFARVTGSGGISGAQWVRFTCNAITAPILWTRDMFGIELFSQYVASWNVRIFDANTAGTVTLIAYLYDDTGADVGSYPIDTVEWDQPEMPEGSWKRRSAPIVLPGGAKFARLGIFTSAAGDAVFDVDAVRLELVGDSWQTIDGTDGRPAFENDFSNNTGEDALGYRVSKDGELQMRGYPKSTADHQNASESDDGNTVFTLPEVCRPGLTKRFIAPSNGLPGHIVVLPTGEVRVTFGMKEGIDFSVVRFYQ